MYVLAVIECASRRIRILGAAPHPITAWVTRAAKNLVMDLEDACCRARYLIRDRDGKFPHLFDSILADAGIQVVLSWNQRHLLHALHEFEQFYNEHHPHQDIASARPMHPLPAQITNPDKIADLDTRRHDRRGASFTSTGMLRDLHG